MKCITGIYTSLNEVEETFQYDAVKDLQIISPSTINRRERKRQMRFKKLCLKGIVILIVFLPIRSAQIKCDPSAQEPTCGDNAQCIEEKPCECWTMNWNTPSCGDDPCDHDCCAKNICQCNEGREFKMILKMNSELDLITVNRVDVVKYHYQRIPPKGYKREDPQDDESACIELKLTDKCEKARFVKTYIF